MSNSEWRTRVRWVIVHPQQAKVLMVDRAGVASLPETELEGEVWTADATTTLPALHELVGVDAVYLCSLDEQVDASVRVQQATLLATPRGSAPLPAGAAWVGRDDLDGAAPPVAVAARVLEELAGDRPRPGRAPWAVPGWFPAAERWLRSSLEALGYQPTGPLHQLRVWELSCVMRVPTTRGAVYFKAAVDSPLFVDEGAVITTLADLFPGQVPVVLAVDSGRRWMLLADFGDELGWDAPVEVREEVIRAWARIQVEAASQVGRLLGGGCLDRRLDWLAGQAQGWLPAIDQTSRLPGIDSATWLSEQELAELRAAVPRLTAICDELAGFAVPPTIVHGDLHLGNVANGPCGYLFFDLTDACVAHPFVDLLTFFQEDEEEMEAAVQERLRRAYLSEWTRFEPAERLERAWRLAAPLGALNHAISYRSLVANLEPPIDRHMTRATASWLRQALAGLRETW